MPSIEHETVVEILLKHPATTVALLNRVLRTPLPPHASIEARPSSSGQLLPTEFSADGILELKDEQGEPLVEIIVEVQLQIDEDKPYSWLAYLANRRAKSRKRVVLAIVTWDKTVARWARKPIELDFGQGVLTFPVIDSNVIPKITELTQAKEDPYLAVLSALAHGHDDSQESAGIAYTTLVALLHLPNKEMDSESAQAYLLTIWRGLGALAKKIVEQRLMQSGVLKNLLQEITPQEKHILQRLKEVTGRWQAESKAEGKAEGTVLALRWTLLDAVELRKIPISSEERARIETCNDEALLRTWVHNAFTASTAEALFSTR